MQVLNYQQAKTLYVKILGKNISAATWSRTYKIFDSNFPLTSENVKAIAEIKKLIPSTSLKSIKVIENLKKSRNFISKNGYKISGKQILDMFKTYEINVHPNTLTNWFKCVKGFSQIKEYSLYEIMPILIQAHCYSLKKQLKEVANNQNLFTLKKII
jgi:hypothetical protein